MPQNKATLAAVHLPKQQKHNFSNGMIEVQKDTKRPHSVKEHARIVVQWVIIENNAHKDLVNWVLNFWIKISHLMISLKIYSWTGKVNVIDGMDSIQICTNKSYMNMSNMKRYANWPNINKDNKMSTNSTSILMMLFNLQICHRNMRKIRNIRDWVESEIKTTLPNIYWIWIKIQIILILNHDQWKLMIDSLTIYRQSDRKMSY